MSKKGLRFIALCISALALLVSTTSAQTQTRQTKVIQRAPSRTIKDPYSAFISVSVDVSRNEIILEATQLTYGIAVDESTQEMFLTTQHPAAILVWPKQAKDKDAPLRIIEGDHTQLAEAQGIALDTKNQLIYVSNKGAWAGLNNNVGWARLYPQPGAKTWNINQATRVLDFVPGTGEDRGPSITVHPLKGQGDIAPVLTIKGPQTRLNWPSEMSIDVDHQELYVTNPVTNEILVFRATDSGNVAPIRVLKGSKTFLNIPN